MGSVMTSPRQIPRHRGFVDEGQPVPTEIVDKSRRRPHIQEVPPTISRSACAIAFTAPSMTRSFRASSEHHVRLDDAAAIAPGNPVVWRM